MLVAQYTKGGVLTILIPGDKLEGSRLCDSVVAADGGSLIWVWYTNLYNFHCCFVPYFSS